MEQDDQRDEINLHSNFWRSWGTTQTRATNGEDRIERGDEDDPGTGWMLDRYYYKSGVYTFDRMINRRQLNPEKGPEQYYVLVAARPDIVTSLSETSNVVRLNLA